MPGRAVLPRLGRLAARLPLAALAALPVWAYLGTETALAARLIVVATAAAAAVSPSSALLVIVGLLPLAGPLSALLGCSAPHAMGEPLVLAFLAGWLLNAAIRPGAGTGKAIGALLAPALLLAAAVAASAAVQVLGSRPGAAGPLPDVWAVLEFLGAGYFRQRGDFQAVAAAAVLLEGIGLLAASLALAARTRGFGARLLAMAACGAAGIGLFSLVRLVTVSLRSDSFWTALGSHIQTIRISAAFPDPNAAGSYLAMCLLVAVGLALAVPAGGAGKGRPRTLGLLLWPVVILLVTAGLWLTGSRTAMLAVVPAAAMLVPIARRAMKPLSARAAVLVLLGAALMLPLLAGRLNPPDITGRSLPSSFGFRTEMTRMALRMIAAHPVFGVGVGRVHASSGAYFTPSFKAIVPRENTHNNFLQVLAELGLAGFLPFMWLLAAVGAAIARSWREGRLSSAAKGGAAGLVAFVVTWLTGHPLLIFEVAIVFWAVSGAVAALASEDARAGEPPARDRFRFWVVLLSAAGLMASVPFRGR